MILLQCFIFGMISFLMRGVQCQETSEVFVEAGSQAVLPCKYDGRPSDSPAVIWAKTTAGTIWRKERGGLLFTSSSWIQKGVKCPHAHFDDYSLHINNVREDDAGVYSCTIDLGVSKIVKVVRLRIITVSFFPPVPISGENVSITCTVTSGPAGAFLWWVLNNYYMSSATINQNTAIAKNVMTVQATPKLTGKWSCVVTYRGTEGRASATLSVKGIIHPPMNNAKVYAAVGSAVTLPCVFSSDLIPSSPSWEKLQPGSQIKIAPGGLPSSFSPPSQSSKQPWDRSAHLKEVEFKDEGRYQCTGTAQRQKLIRNMQLVVAKIESSEPFNKKGPMMLTCQLSDASEVTDYEWVHVTYDFNGTRSVQSIHKGKTVTISQESEETTGEWTCQFSGKDGVLGNVTYHVHLVGGLSGQKSKGLSQNTAAVVGLSFLLVVLLLILAQMYKNYQRRKRILPYPALETIVHTISNEREEKERNRGKL